MGWKTIEARREYQRTYYKKWREDNRQKTRDSTKKYHSKHKERKKVYREIYEKMNKEQIRDRTRVWKKKNKEKLRNQHLKRTYGITLEEYNNMLIAQNNSCSICLISIEDTKEKRNLAVDHCHTTGKIRGLLCMNCNKSLGLLKDNPLIVKNMLEYLIKNQQK